MALLYGEVSPEVIREAARGLSGLFVDIGCGRGLTLQTASDLGFYSIGIEFVKERATEGDVIHGDALDGSFVKLYERADLIFCAATAFDDLTMRRLVATLQTRARVATTLKRLPSVEWRVTRRFEAPCSWGTTPVLIHERDRPGAIQDWRQSVASQLVGLDERTVEAAAAVVIGRDFDKAAGAFKEGLRAARQLDPSDCFLVDHAVTWTDEMPPCERVVEILGSVDPHHKLVGSYAVQFGDRIDKFYFIPDELGKAAFNDEGETNALLMPIFDVETRMAFSLLFPTTVIEEDDVIVAGLMRSHTDATPTTTAATTNSELLDFALKPALDKAMS